MIWKTRKKSFELGRRRALVMGIVNVTDNSFSDGGRFLRVEDAVAHGLELLRQGADIIDVGGESTRPGSAPVEAEEELARVLPVVEQLAVRCVVSVDTSKAEVALRAVEKGAAIINDVTGLRGDPRMTEVARESGAGVVIMHMQGTPRDMQLAPHYQDVVTEVREFFRQRMDHAIGCGLDPQTIVFDPGIGFGKTVKHNLLLIKELDRLRVAKRPLVLGVSRKSFIGTLLKCSDMAERFWPTVALTSFGREHGANVLRVHDVEANVHALRMIEAILEAQ